MFPFVLTLLSVWIISGSSFISPPHVSSFISPTHSPRQRYLSQQERARSVISSSYLDSLSKSSGQNSEEIGDVGYKADNGQTVPADVEKVNLEMAGNGAALSVLSETWTGMGFTEPAPDLFEVLPSDRKLADSLFAYVDSDSNGVIDEEELTDVIAKIRVDTRAARVVLPFVALLGGYAVSKFSQKEFQIARALTRKAFIDKVAENAMNSYFPGALISKDCDEAVAKVLYKRGYTAANTLFGSSLCPDEVNSGESEVFGLMRSRWGESFSLGGLGGVPFAGKSGFGAYVHHVPVDGKLFVVFAPHVGVSNEGKVGQLQRQNQVGASTACGAAIGAYKLLKNDPSALENIGDPVSEVFDLQIKFIAARLQPLLDNIGDSQDDIAFVTYQMFKLIREFLVNEIVATPDMWDDTVEIAVLGGIMINRQRGGDFFQPLLFESRRKSSGSTVNLFTEAFGKKPDLTEILGSEMEAREITKTYPLNKFIATSREDVPTGMQMKGVIKDPRKEVGADATSF